jgi:glycosyltransferase involved in cell wall biosynthesis
LLECWCHETVANRFQHEVMNIQIARHLKVALVTETYPPEINGVAATFAKVVDALKARGHRLDLVRPRQSAQDRSSDTSEWWRETLTSGLPIPRYPQLRLGLPAAGLLTRLWTDRRPDVVHVATEGPLGWSALVAARRLNLPVVSEFRTNFHAYASHYGFRWLGAAAQKWLRHFHNRTDLTMVPTQQLAQELASHGFERLSVIARGVDAQRFDPRFRDLSLRAHWGAGENTRVALSVGRLAPEKNLDSVIEAWRSLQSVYPDTRLIFVGDGPSLHHLQQACPEAIFTGALRGAGLSRAYASADIFFFASETETFGNVVPEAMASGLAVLAFNDAAARELIAHRSNGLTTPKGDKETFVAMAREFGGDLSTLQRWGEEARATALRLDWGHIVSAIEAEYHKAIYTQLQIASPFSSVLQNQ